MEKLLQEMQSMIDLVYVCNVSQYSEYMLTLRSKTFTGFK